MTMNDLKLTKVVFLDIDGVLNHSDPGEDVYYDKFDSQELPICQDNIDALKKILETSPDAKIVWTTDWRYFSKPMWNRWKNPLLWLESQPFMKDRIIGKTPMKMSSEHFHDIKWWLEDRDDVKKYVILEDSYFPEEWFGLEKHLIRVNHTTGLTVEDADNALKILDRYIEDDRHVRHIRRLKQDR